MSHVTNIEVFPKRFQSEEVKKLYSELKYFSQKVNNEDSDNIIENKWFYSFRLIPEYFDLTLRDDKYKERWIWQSNWGYSILLKNNDTLESYMKSQFNSKKRSIIRRYVNRLESCFNVSYKMIYGSINKEQYTFLMDCLKEMIVARFKERNESHKNMLEWESLMERTFNDINSKKASLFVIYSDKKPVEISLNYHYHKVLFSYISSYDIDYSKFGLGHVEIYKQLEWCIENGYILFEMGVGGTDYKRRWSNNIYRYKQYFIYNSTSRIQVFMVHMKILKANLKEYLKSKKLNEILPKLHAFLTEKRKVSKSVNKSEIKDIHNLMNASDYEELEVSGIEGIRLKRYINDFLYTSVEHIRDIRLYRINHQNSFLIKGEQKYQYITFK